LSPLHFTLAGVVYDVASEGECTIPDEFAYAVARRGLPLVKAPVVAVKEVESLKVPTVFKKASASTRE
jgi:hypothetical protein